MGKVVKIAVGLMMIAAVVWGYHNGLSHAIQLTCMANLCCGILLVVDGMANLLAKKAVPVFLWVCPKVCVNLYTDVRYTYQYGGLFYGKKK